MATPLTADRMLAILRAEGLAVREHAGWRTHNRDGATGKTFGPVIGVLIHHTAGHGDRELCFNGRPDLPGPLCHAWLGKTDGLWLLGNGRTNHAGSVDLDVLNALLAEKSPLPADDEANADGNDALYGLEIENLGNGRDPYPAGQYDEAVRWAAAICRFHGWSEKSVAGHKEVQPGKVDPSFDLNVFRAKVAERLAHAPGWNPNEEDDVALTTDDINKVAIATVNHLIAGGGVLEGGDVARVATAVAAKLQPIEIAQNATIDKLVGAVATLAANIGDLDPAAIVAELRASIESITIHLDVPES